MNAWAATSSCTPRCARHTAPRVSAPRLACRYAALVGSLAAGAAAGERLADRRTMRLRAAAVLRALGIRVTLTVPGAAALSAPRPPGGPGTLIVADHISWLDVLTLLAVEPVTVLAKREVGRWPLLGPLARKAGTRFIDREGLRALPHVVAELAGLLREGRSVLVFPQGTTWCSAAAGRFRRATFQAAVDAGAPVRPVTVTYAQHGIPSTVAAFLGDEGFGRSLHRVAAAGGLTVRVTVHPPLEPAVDRRALAERAQRVIRAGEPPAHG
ncbi:lysophospholipid acyltransferase family protein [Streptomyces sp. NRRL F-5755]|uniref:lysophospholipid acyltransferase family protein n=1 Tax=Streptomyces sp. NRRL F-5755 TaxID=1519475 RepID=UPI000AC2CC06|nr:lysophospholipid acyltransferase family protein [Streptomyces sp. NRRL F-5755]